MDILVLGNLNSGDVETGVTEHGNRLDWLNGYLSGTTHLSSPEPLCGAKQAFEYLCDQDPSLTFGDETVKIILNTKGTMDDVSLEMKRLLEYIDGQAASDEFTKELEDAVQSVRRNEKWRLGYMTLQQEYREKYNEGLEAGIVGGICAGSCERN